MDTDAPHSITPTKAELLCNMVGRYPSIDFDAIQIVSHIQAIGKKLSAINNHLLAEYGLTEGKFYVLAYLFSEEVLGNDARSPSQIADHIGITRGTVTGLLDGLEREGYLERFHDTRDRRGLTIQITDKSRAFLDSFLPNAITFLADVIPLNDKEKSEIIDLLARLDLAFGRITPAVTE
jgi:MarR family transcriptional repressor of emrRAB